MFASGLPGASRALAAGGVKAHKIPADFYFLQLSDTHWGFAGAPNPEADRTLKETVAAVNSLSRQPDFIVFTGDLTHTTEDAAVRRQRMAQFKEIVAGLKVKDVRYLPGEHDASLDAGAAYQEHFGALHQAFDYKGVHFVALDNVSDPSGSLGEAQIDWLRKDLAKRDPAAPLVVLTHRPLFDLYPQWDWTTKDGAKAIDVLSHHKNVTVLYGHIHQEHHQTTDGIAHHSARSLIFPLPAPGSVPKKGPVAWDAAHPGAGLGFRSVGPDAAHTALALTELPYKKA